MTRCWAFCPDDRFAFGIIADWWSPKRPAFPMRWGNDNRWND